MKDSKAGTVITCALGNDSATTLFGTIHGVAIGRTTKSVWSCVTGTNQLIDLAMTGVGNPDTETSKRINPETGEEEPDDDYDYQQIFFDVFNIGGGIGPSVPPSVCIAECNSRFSPFYARCRQMGHPATMEACLAFVAAVHAACIAAGYM